MAKKILIIDDEPTLVELVANRLKASGYRPLTAASGNEGLERATKEKPDLILLDIMMPGMDGHQLLRHLKAQTKTESIPVMMLSARKWNQDIQKAMNEGAVDYVTKPFDPVDLLEKIESALNGALSRSGIHQKKRRDTSAKKNSYRR